MLRFALFLTLALFLAPIGAGLIGTVLPAFGYLPALGLGTLSLQPWRDLAATPAITASLRLTLVSGVGATILSFALAIGFCATVHGRPWMQRLERVVAPILATPHAAIAIGFAFLILPSGWIARLISPELTGWSRPPLLVTVRDPYGLSLIAGLVLKETPYLILMIIGASAQVRVHDSVALARTLGYRPAKAWLSAVLPRIYPQIRLPVFAVLAFSLSVVDVALVLGPGTPPTLAIQATRWFLDYDLSLYPRAAAAAMLQLLIALTAIGVWRLAEGPAAWLGRCWLRRGVRRDFAGLAAGFGAGGALLAGVAAFAAMAAMLVWSIAADWWFPDAVPAGFTVASWARLADDLSRPFWLTLAIGSAATLLALLLALLCLEQEQRVRRKPNAGVLWLLYLPLLVPQIAFLFGAQVALVRLGLDGTLLAVVWAHLLFVLPYVFLSLADPFRALDVRYVRSAASLGVGPGAAFLRIKLPMLTRPIMIAAAVGFAVSVGQYLPTLFAGAGRITTLTTEALTLSSGADRRILGVYATLQAALPLALYTAALVLPRILFSNRRSLA
jgi:putative thiamine transport system permease protein